MNRWVEHWFSYGLIIIWFIVCIVSQKLDMVTRFANKGIAIIGGEYYRFATALLLHKSLLHTFINASAMFFVGSFLEPQVSPWKLVVFSMLAGIITETVFSVAFKESVSMGGSPVIFALIGLIISIQIMKADSTKFQLGTWYGNWTVGYTVLANIPLFSDSFVSALFIHGCSIAVGLLLGCLCIALRFF